MLKKKVIGKLISRYLADFARDAGLDLYDSSILYSCSNDQIFGGLYFNPSRFGPTITIDVFVMPLFMRTDFVGWTVGKRIGTLTGQVNVWWNIEDDHAPSSFREIAHAAKKYAIPWLEEHSRARALIVSCLDSAGSLAGELEVATYAALWLGEKQVAQLLSERLLHIYKGLGLELPRRLDDLQTLLSLSPRDARLALEKNVEFSRSTLQIEKKTMALRKPARAH